GRARRGRRAVERQRVARDLAPATCYRSRHGEDAILAEEDPRDQQATLHGQTEGEAAPEGEDEDESEEAGEGTQDRTPRGVARAGVARAPARLLRPRPLTPPATERRCHASAPGTPRPRPPAPSVCHRW